MPRQSSRQQRRDPREQDWGPEANRQYEEIEASQEQRGASRDRAEEIAARTVNKQRARSGQAEQRSKRSTEDISAPRRGGIRSGNRYGPGGRTKDQLYADAKAQGIRGRSKMSKAELEKHLAR
ncbi:plasmid stabilization protein [Bounagaea algeriensis]